MEQRIWVDGTEVLIEGQGETALVMVHGWPDTYRLWDHQVAYFERHYRCVRFTLPGFDQTQPCRAYALDEITVFLHQLINAVSPRQKVILLLHDWGCLFGYELAMQHPELVAGVIGVDVGEMLPRDKVTPFKALLILCGYFSWLALAWRIGGRLGNWMTRTMARLLQAPTKRQDINCCMNYPYYIAVTGAYGSYKKHQPFKPVCPTLYIYGSKKPLLFHSKKWLEQISRQPGCTVLEWDAYHWLMLEQAGRFNQTVDNWMRSQLGKASPHSG